MITYLIKCKNWFAKIEKRKYKLSSQQCLRIEYERNVIIEFPSYEKAKAAYESDEYKKALGVLGDGMERTLVIVEGEEETK